MYGVYSLGNSFETYPMAWLSGVSLSFVGSYKYLEFTVAPTLSDKLHVKLLSRSLCCRANLLICEFRICDPSVRCFLFRAYCSPLDGLVFVLSLSVKCENPLRVLYNNSLRWLLNLPLNCSASKMFVGGGLPSFPELSRKSSLSIQTRILLRITPSFWCFLSHFIASLCHFGWLGQVWFTHNNFDMFKCTIVNWTNCFFFLLIVFCVLVFHLFLFYVSGPKWS